MQQGRPPIKPSLLPKLIGQDVTFTSLHSSSDAGIRSRLACSLSAVVVTTSVVMLQLFHMYIHCAFVHLTLSHSLPHRLTRSLTDSLLHLLIHSFVNALCVFPYGLVTCKPLIASCMRFCFGTRRTDIHVCRCCYNALRLLLASLFDAFLARKQALHDLETL